MVRKFAVLVMAGLIVLVGHPVWAETLRGQTYYGIGAMVLTPADNQKQEIFGELYGIQGFASKPLTAHLDLNASLGLAWADATGGGYDYSLSSTVVTGGVTYSFLPGQRVNPYVSPSLSLYRTTYEVTGPGVSIDETENDLGYGAVAGTEIVLNQTSFLDLNYNQSWVDGESSSSIKTGIGFWLSPRMLTSVTYTFDLESSEDSKVTFGFSVRP